MTVVPKRLWSRDRASASSFIRPSTSANDAPNKAKVFGIVVGTSRNARGLSCHDYTVKIGALGVESDWPEWRLRLA